MTRYDPTDERDYNVRAALPDHLATLAMWRQRSEAFCMRLASEGRYSGPHSYGKPEAGDAETLDLFLPVRQEQDARHPLHIFIHGGYWQALDRRDQCFLAEAFVDAGVAVAVVNYSLCPAVTLDGIIVQVVRAISWLWEHADEHGIDRGAIQLGGHSAGGHLAAMMMTHDWSDLTGARNIYPFQSVVAVSGLFDLTPLLDTSINDKVGLDAPTASHLSPVEHTPVVHVPLILAVGARESGGFHGQSDKLMKAWEPHGVRVTRLTLPDRDHLSAVEALAETSHPLFEAAQQAICSASKIPTGGAD